MGLAQDAAITLLMLAHRAYPFLADRSLGYGAGGPELSFPVVGDPFENWSDPPVDLVVLAEVYEDEIS